MSTSTLPASAFEGLELSPEYLKAVTAQNARNALKTKHSAHGLRKSTPTAVCANETFISLYAELLLNIRTVTLFASLRTVHNHETRAILSADGDSITVSHEGRRATIRLPTKIKGGGDAGLELPSQPPAKELTLRLQLEEKEGTRLLEQAQPGDRELNYVPWDATELKSLKHGEIFCKKCQTRLIRGGAIEDWKDLPNENWAEMMDFWHCHKPHEHHTHHHEHGKEPGAAKGYAAGNRLKARRATGFVDQGLLLLQKSDCENIETISPEKNESNRLICGTCRSRVGSVDEGAEGWRIWKWSIRISASLNPRDPMSYATEKWVAAQFLTLIENEGVRKFSVNPEDPDVEGETLLLWIFTPDLSFSSSIPSPHRERHDPTRAMKIFWQQKKALIAGKPDQDHQTFSVEEVTFPSGIFRELKDTLETSQALLPTNARQFQGWQVGLLQRFEGNGTHAPS